MLQAISIIKRTSNISRINYLRRIMSCAAFAQPKETNKWLGQMQSALTICAFTHQLCAKTRAQRVAHFARAPRPLPGSILPSPYTNPSNHLRVADDDQGLLTHSEMVAI
jgi:hypothetical protein